MKKRRRIILMIAAAVMLLAALSFIYIKVTQDPNYLMKKTAVKITEDKTEKVSYDFGHLFVPADRRIPVYEFVPAEAAEYTFEVTDISSGTGDNLFMSVVDRSFSEYISTNNLESAEAEDRDTGTFSDKAYLQKGRRYYVFIDAANAEGSRLHDGSFRITVRKSEEEIIPVEITEDQAVRIDVKAGEQSSVVFTPPETGFYRFDTEIVNGNASKGYSAVSGVTSEESDDTVVTDGVCRLEVGREYLIQISVEEIKGTVQVDVSCRRIGSGEFDENGTATLDSAAMIEYTAEEDGNILVFSESEGDPEVTIYDSKGFPLRTDDDSGEEFGGGSEDFAVIIKARKGKLYYVYVSGKFSECKVNTAKYGGDVSEPEEETVDEAADETSLNGESGEADGQSEQ